jgi:chromosomal replication initiator protein
MDCSTVWVICSGQVIEWDENGDPIRMIGCHVDISDRKDTEVALQNNEQLFRTLFEQSMIGIAFSRLDAPIPQPIRVNPRLCEMLGYTESELLAMTFVDITYPEDVPLAESVVKNIAKTRKAITISAIKKLVCRHARISEEDLVSRSRKQSVVRPRQIAIYLSRKYTDQSLQSIGRSFNRYHATALHAIACVERGLKQDPRMRSSVDYLCQKLEAGKH